MRAGTLPVALGVALVFALAVLHLTGGRVHVGFLSGTMPSSSESVTLGLAYATSWFAAVLLAPVLIISGAVHRWLAPKPAPRPGR